MTTQHDTHPAKCGVCDFYGYYAILNGTEYGYCPQRQGICAEQSEVCTHFSNIETRVLGCAGRD